MFNNYYEICDTLNHANQMKHDKEHDNIHISIIKIENQIDF